MNERLGNHYLSTQRTGSQECSDRTFTSPTNSGALAQAGQILLLLGQVIPFPPFTPTHPFLSPAIPTLEHLFLPFSSNQIPNPSKVVLHPLLFHLGSFPCRSTECTLESQAQGPVGRLFPGREGRVGDFCSRRAKANRWAAEITLEGC